MKLWHITRSRGEYMPYQVLLAVAVTPFMDWGGISNLWFLATLFFVALFYVCLIEAYLHRWCTHRSYEISKPVEYVLAFLACVVPATGSTVGWSAIHKAHHRHSDTELDPHSARHSSFFNLLLGRYPNKGSIISSRRLLTNKVHRSLHLYYVVWLYVWAGFWYVVAGLNGLYFCVLLPWALGPIMSTIQNFGLHLELPFSYRNFCTSDYSQNSPLLHILSFGACGLHNNHHARPRAWDSRARSWEVDTAATFISLIRKK